MCGIRRNVQIVAVCACMCVSWAASALSPVRTVEITGTPTMAGNIRITIGSHTLTVHVQANATCADICAAAQQAAMNSADDFWRMTVKIDCLCSSGSNFLRIRHCEGSDLGTARIDELNDAPVPMPMDIPGVSFADVVRPNTVFKIGNITQPPERPAGGPTTTYTMTVTINLPGLPAKMISIAVDNNSSSTPEGNMLPTTVDEIASALRAAIDADARFIADRNSMNCLFVYAETNNVSFDPLLRPTVTAPWTINPPVVGPLVMAVRPERGPLGGGQQVGIYCSYTSGTDVSIIFGGVPVSIMNYDPLQQVYTVLTPPHAAGFVDVTVISAGETQNPLNTVPAGYEYTAAIPTLSEWGLLAMGGLLLVAGAAFTRRMIA
ncbi:MAG: IPT/TIG domain-containing protein [Phycisphaerales bacterium]